ncbi:U3 small nucleolar RNA-interacting protein 2 isoform X2 [Cephus cinctus]|uniref:U3 small nucleolar RNA-interacting protein 2 isoform X2 n=1 Tax=Cephus cinctus TaxID=211228 RepID=A0AAJ7CFU9_CEPCN|nr:U3 small nucleolar RNA-interacting protein 2 isoform X2 [Cephus cinctus]
MSFFIRNSRGGGAPKRKFNGRAGKGITNGPALKTKRTENKKFIPNDDESIASSDEEFAEERQREKDKDFEDESEEEEETAQEKRLRLAKKYLKEIEEEEKDRAEFEEGAVSRRLQEEYLEEKGRLRKTVASNYVGHKEPIVLKCKDHKDSITCLCLSSNGTFIYSGSKNGSLVKWSMSDKSKLKVLKGKGKTNDGIKCVRCIAISTDSKFLVVGDTASKDIKIFSGDDLSHIKNLQGHRGPVTGLVFRKDTHTLYSASEDRSVKVWNLDDMAYVESLFGHQTGITSIDALSRERAITSGGFDKTVRIWKIVEESQLIFNGHSGSIDVVKLINEENFLSCGADGQLCVWGSLKKRPLCSVAEAHGKDETNGQPMWISSIATLLNTDLVASGSNDGVIRLWQCGESFRALNPLFEIKLTGFINALAFTPDGHHLIVGVGQEHKLGRWWRIPEAKNSIVVIPLIQNKAKK